MKLRLMTYNVHRCVGVDRDLNVERVAAVIADARPDIVALQELDVGRMRSRAGRCGWRWTSAAGSSCR